MESVAQRNLLNTAHHFKELNRQLLWIPQLFTINPTDKCDQLNKTQKLLKHSAVYSFPGSNCCWYP